MAVRHFGQLFLSEVPFQTPGFHVIPENLKYFIIFHVEDLSKSPYSVTQNIFCLRLWESPIGMKLQRLKHSGGNFTGTLVVFTALVVILGLSGFSLAQSNPSNGQPTKFSRAPLSENARAVLAHDWAPDSVEKGLALIADRKETADSRRAVLEKFQAQGKRLDSPSLRRLFKQTSALAADSTEEPGVSIASIRAMTNAGVLLTERRAITQNDIKKESGFLVEAGRDKGRDVVLRGAAIRATGILKVDEARPMLRERLGDSTERETPEIAQNAMLALTRLEGAEAIEPISNILRSTSNQAIFGTAAFSIGQYKTKEAMVRLVQTEKRFPNSTMPDAALVNMEDVVSEILNSPHDVNLFEAIQATRHLWRKGQRERYLPKLRSLLTTAPMSLRKAALDRLLEVAGTYKLVDEKEELKKTLPLISGQTELSEYAEHIQRRLSAVVLVPVATERVPANMKAVVR
jgi:hypothetical protein